MGKAKLHEVLAVENELAGADQRIREETTHTFHAKADHFIGWHKRYEPLDEDGEQMPDEHHQMVTTVHDKLAYMFEHVGRYLDVVYQKEATNQEAKADIVVGDTVLAKDVPATFLLGLETKLKNLRKVFDEIPTLPPGIEVKPAPEEGDHVYAAVHPQSRRKTKKEICHKVLVEPTEHHPAQIEKWTEDVPVGWTHQKMWYGMLSPSEKSELLGRIDELARAVKKARQRANCTEVTTNKIAKPLIDFIMGS